ncbi:MAG TPA: pentapeptide repeat-containing protein [Candidatus Sulfotelmatobacter sp.]|nr:pentapeptide repeat-containing protein [Candidatus Sulfotelmatobacter sp.]
MFTLEGADWKIAFKAAVEAGQKFECADLSDKDFSGIEVNCKNSRFDNSSFDNSRFDNSSFYNSRFDNSRFYNSRFDNSSFDNSSFDEKSFKAIPEQWFIQCRDDLWSILLTVPDEVKFLRKALVDGKVNGSTYTGECACLVGTIANGRKCQIENLGILKPNASRMAERYFLQIRPGGIPEKNPFAKKAVEWIDQFVELQVAAAKVFTKKK